MYNNIINSKNKKERNDDYGVEEVWRKINKKSNRKNAKHY